MINYLPPILTYKIFTILLFVAFQCVTLVNAQECGVVYVTPNGSSSGVAGTKANPANLNYGLQLASPQNPLIKISTGAYSISSPLIIRDSLILEGGYLPTMGWAKTNKDSTVITRTNANIEANPERIVAVKCENIKGFKIKDLRIVVQSATNNGVSLYGVYLNSCRNYNLTRVWVRTGRAGDGVNGVNGVNGANGADGTMGGLGTPYEPNVTGTYMVDIFNDIPQNGSASPYTVDGGNGGNSWSVGSNSGGNGGDGGLRGVGTNCLPGFTCANSDPCNSQNGPINAPDGQNGLSGNGIGAGSGGPGKLGYNFCAFNQGDQVEIVNFLLSCP